MSPFAAARVHRRQSYSANFGSVKVWGVAKAAIIPVERPSPRGGRAVELRAYRALMNGPGFDGRMRRVMLIMALLVALAYGTLHGVPLDWP